MADPTSRITEELAPVYRTIAIKWLVWDRGMTAEDAAYVMSKWPDSGQAAEAVDVATFIVDECHGR